MLENLKSFGFDVSTESVVDIPERYIGVRVRTLVHQAVPELTGLVLTRPTMAQSEIQVRQFEFIQLEDGRTLMEFVLLSPGHRSFWDTGVAFDPTTFRRTCMTFADFCWQRARETTPESARESGVSVPAGELGDLTWRLPGKLVDDLVETMYVLNADILNGTMMDSWLYGPLIFDGVRWL